MSDDLIHMDAPSGWEIEGKNVALVREFVFGDFSEAWGFVSRVALLAEVMNHHPEYTHSFSRVKFRLSTHDAGDVVTGNDHALARAINKLARS